MLINPNWLTDSVLGVANAALTDPGILPILADALEESGCDNKEALEELRHPRVLSGDFLKKALENVVQPLLRDPKVILIEWNNFKKHEAKIARETKYVKTRKDLAKKLAEGFHARIQDLHTSKRAEIAWGKGGQEDLDWDAYGKGGKNYCPNGRGIPAKWRNSGVRITGYAKTGRVVLETHRGTEVARLPMPPLKAIFNSGALVMGDLYCLPRKICGVELRLRFGVTFKKKIAVGYEPTGVAIRFAVPEDCRQQGSELYGVFRTTEKTYWEHGLTVGACRQEFNRKLKLAEEIRTRVALSTKVHKLANRIAKCCPGLVVTDADRKAAGYCEAGTSGFLNRHGLSGQSFTAAQLRMTGAAEVERPILEAARRVAAGRVKREIS